MKVFLVSEGTYSDYHIEGVYSTKEKAEQYVLNHTDPQDGEIEDRLKKSDYNIEEMEMDSSLAEVVEYATQYNVRLELGSGNGIDLQPYQKSWRVIAQKGYRGRYFISVNYGYVDGQSVVSEEHALKLAADGRQHWLRIKDTVEGNRHFYSHIDQDEEKK